MRYIAVLFFSLIVMAGCTRQVYVPVESVKTEYRDVHTRDSVFVRDSVLLKMKGDTVFLEKYRLVYKDRIVRDSIFKNDTIRVPYPVEKVIYKRDYKLILGLLIVLGLVLSWRKFKRILF